MKKFILVNMLMVFAMVLIMNCASAYSQQVQNLLDEAASYRAQADYATTRAQACPSWYFRFMFEQEARDDISIAIELEGNARILILQPQRSGPLGQPSALGYSSLFTRVVQDTASQTAKCWQ
jgi:hypothetical protein